MNYKKYAKAYHNVPITRRTWPDNEITEAPAWCNVDLRDGNQALVVPMSLEEKLEYFAFLVRTGFKEIEVAFPAASDTDFHFVRTLIENHMIPDDVTIQVLTQSRPHIIQKTVEAVDGAKNAIIHLYNSTSTLQRRVVFGKGKDEIIQLAVDGAKLVKEICEQSGNEGLRYEYSPESFVGTEMDYAAEICNAVLDVWQPTSDKKVIINLPSTVEMSTSNVYADQIEYMSGALKYRDNVILSVHAHNDRGCGVAASELALLAGAQRVEGTMFGNGERTGNADILVMALNMYSQGIDPKLDFSDVEQAKQMYEKVTHLSVHPRHPYAGELVYTAFSGSHQDAIKKGMDFYEKNDCTIWENPYLPINPADLGRDYEPVRINSQSGKGGVAFILEKKFGLVVPKDMVQEFSYVVTAESDTKQAELSPEEILNLFKREYLNIDDKIKLLSYEVAEREEKTVVNAKMMIDSEEQHLKADGNGPLDAVCRIIRSYVAEDIEIATYHEHALEHGSSSMAMAYVSIKNGGGAVYWGAGADTNIITASLKALISAVNRKRRVSK